MRSLLVLNVMLHQQFCRYDSITIRREREEEEFHGMCGEFHHNETYLARLVSS